MLTDHERHINNLRRALLYIDTNIYRIDKIIVSPFFLEAFDEYKSNANLYHATLSNNAHQANIFGHPIEIDFTAKEPYQIKTSKLKVDNSLT